MTVLTKIKDPTDVISYTIDWTTDDRWIVGDTITVSTWTADTGLTLGNGSNGAPLSSFTSPKTTVWMLTGTAGVEYIVTNHVTTQQGQQLDKQVIVSVQRR